MLRLSWLLALSLIAPFAVADTPRASVSYDELHDMLQKAATAGNGLEHIGISSLHVTSVLCGVTVSDIHLQMQPAGKPAVALPLTADGSLQLPMDPALYRENPLILSNQPKHSLEISAAIKFIPPTAGPSTYRVLMTAVGQINTLIHREAGMLSWFAPKVEGLIFLFRKNPATLTIHTPKGDSVMQAGTSPYQFLPADTRIIQVKYDQDLYASNPAVDLSVAPTDVMPLMDPGTMKKMNAAPGKQKCKPNPAQRTPSPTSQTGLL